jgi:HK97 family phage major capsid protein
MNAESILKALEGVEANLETRNREIDERLIELEQRGGAMPHEGVPGANPLAKLANDAGIAAVRDRTSKSASVPIAGSLSRIVKAVAGDAGAEQYEVQPQRDNRLGANPQRRLSIFDVLPSLQVSSNAFTFNKLDSYTNAAANQSAEGAAKAAGTMPTALVTVPIVTIAHYFKLSEQVLSDAPQLQAQVSNLLQYGVLAKASSQILAGATAGKIQGLATVATSFATTSGATLADGIGEAMVALDIAGWRADVAVMHPSDWFAIRSERTATEGDYVANGWAGPAEQGAWGLRVVTDPSIAAGSPLVLDSSQVAILDRMAARVEIDRESDDMTKNLVTALGEMRLGLAVFSPTAICKVSLTA